jgi:glycosyltransferase involved in cell wall biosynthesis
MDNSPYSVPEAMRAGLAVVATRVGALPEMVLDGTTGLLVRHDDADFARAIGTLLDQLGRARQMGVAARAHFEAVFDAKRTTAQLLAVLDDARTTFSGARRA